jgi:hypothetical protein
MTVSAVVGHLLRYLAEGMALTGMTATVVPLPAPVPAGDPRPRVWVYPIRRTGRA